MDIAKLLISGFPTLSTGNVADAGGDDVKIMDAGIKALHYSMKAAGPAYTVEIPPGSNLSPPEAFTLAPVGSILVINAHGDMSSGHFGDLMALAAQIHGIAGIVIDGTIRDIYDIINFKFPVFARGGCPRGNHAQKGTVNQPIQCGGIQVNPGDIIFADVTGIVTFHPSKSQVIYNQAACIANSELGFVQKLNEGKTLMQIPDFLKLHHINSDELKRDGINIDSAE